MMPTASSVVIGKAGAKKEGINLNIKKIACKIYLEEVRKITQFILSGKFCQLTK